MSRKRTLETRLQVVEDFDDPTPALEQYRTPPDVAATLVHTAALQGDIENRLVVDLGCGTGMLALAAGMRNPSAVVGLDIDSTALERARRNESRIDPVTPVQWVRSDVESPPLCLSVSSVPVTVLMNPPFGAQRGNEHADRAFLVTAGAIADVSYSIHNAGSADFIESFVTDTGGEVTHAFAAELDLPRSFDFHTEESKSLDVEVFRILWNRGTGR